MNAAYAPDLGTQFLQVADAHGNAPALVFADETVSYRALAATARSIAAGLQAHGLRERDVVAIAGEKTPESFALILACLLSGALYTVLDPENPPERQSRILDRCRPRFLYPGVGASSSALRNAEQDVAVLEPGKLAAPAEALVRPALNGHHPAYIMFTSGSTGHPKGAVMSHANVARLIAWSAHRFGFGPGEVLTNVNPLYFDNSVFEVYAALFTGAALAPFSKEETLDAAGLLQGIAERGCTSWFSVPSFLIYLDSLRALRAGTMPAMRRIIFGGEGFPLARLKSIYDNFADRAEIVNVYGPTECTCICSAYTLRADDFRILNGFPPLGALTPEFSGLVVDEDGAEVPRGTAGELVLYGPCVGLGYYNDPERTEGAFRAVSRSGGHLDRAYHTGDLVEISPEDGRIWIRGRIDNQIKHMGYRIELEEVENALCALAGVHQAAAFHGKRYGNSCLAAAVSGEEGLTEAAVLAEVRRFLPTYMVPSEVHFRDVLPKNANGKLDRQALRDAYLPDQDQ